MKHINEQQELRRISETHRDDVRGGSRKLRSEKLHNLQSSPNVITT
jgi:hypothetical protein